jgi:hypothetical protein
VGKLYNAEKESPNGDRSKSEAGDQNEPRTKTADKIAKETGTSAATVKRAAKKADALDSMPKGLKESILDGKVKATDKAVKAFVAADESKQHEAARAVRTGQAPSLDVAMGLKAAKAEPAAKSSRTSFDVEAIEAEQAAESESLSSGETVKASGPSKLSGPARAKAFEKMLAAVKAIGKQSFEIGGVPKSWATAWEVLKKETEKWGR